MKKIATALLTVGLAAAVQLTMPAAFAKTSYDGFWEGTLTYKEVPLAVRFEITGEGGKPGAFLDIPSLIYAHQPIAAHLDDKGEIVLTFPFGIGAITAAIDKTGAMASIGGKITLAAERTPPPPYTKEDISFGAFDPPLEGTLYMPKGKGPFPAVILLAGSANANRSKWSYASWADFYARQGVAALIYDRRGDMSENPAGTVMTIDDHAGDAAAAIARLKKTPGIDPARIGAEGSSRGAWIAMALAQRVPNLAFVILSSPAPVTPAEQEVDSTLAAMAKDGLGADEISAARNYDRLYFYVVRTMKGWDLLTDEIARAAKAKWGKYVDQPESRDDLRWWQANMDFDGAGSLKTMKMPVLAMWGGADPVTPYAKYRGLLTYDLEQGANQNVTTRVFEGADHRIEIDPGTDSQGNWHWFGLAPGSLKAISEFIREIKK